MKRILKNKRGMAMASAVLFMLITFFFGILLTSVVSLSHLRVKANDAVLKREWTVEQIGQYFVDGNVAELDKLIEEKGYTKALSNGDRTLTLTKNEKTVLIVTVTDGKVAEWKYNEE